jgi:release factor glutamine methyltransferase
MPDARIGAAALACGAGLTVRSVTANLARRLRAAGMPSPDLDARLLASHACGLSRETYILANDRPIDARESAAIDDFAGRRLAGEPVSRILGRREFYGRDFAIGPAVLDPRPDTEALVAAAIDILAAEARTAGSPRILDLGTGSGCILLTLLAELPHAWGVGIDVDPEALKLARGNAKTLTLTSRSAFACMDWVEALNGEFDLIVSNPPYIARDEITTLADDVRLYDPKVALDGGLDGYDAYRAISATCLSVLRPGGSVVVEAGARQAAEIVNLFAEHDVTGIGVEARLFQDLAGINRVVAIKRQAAQ